MKKLLALFLLTAASALADSAHLDFYGQLSPGDDPWNGGFVPVSFTVESYNNFRTHCFGSRSPLGFGDCRQAWGHFVLENNPLTAAFL